MNLQSYKLAPLSPAALPWISAPWPATSTLAPFSPLDDCQGLWSQDSMVCAKDAIAAFDTPFC